MKPIACITELFGLHHGLLAHDEHIHALQWFERNPIAWTHALHTIIDRQIVTKSGTVIRDVKSKNPSAGNVMFATGISRRSFPSALSLNSPEQKQNATYRWPRFKRQLLSVTDYRWQRSAQAVGEKIFVRLLWKTRNWQDTISLPPLTAADGTKLC
jgi:hypothetical protein